MYIAQLHIRMHACARRRSLAVDFSSLSSFARFLGTAFKSNTYLLPTYDMHSSLVKGPKKLLTNLIERIPTLTTDKPRKHSMYDLYSLFHV